MNIQSAYTAGIRAPVLFLEITFGWGFLRCHLPVVRDIEGVLALALPLLRVGAWVCPSRGSKFSLWRHLNCSNNIFLHTATITFFSLC